MPPSSPGPSECELTNICPVNQRAAAGPARVDGSLRISWSPWEKAPWELPKHLKSEKPPWPRQSAPGSLWRAGGRPGRRRPIPEGSSSDPKEVREGSCLGSGAQPRGGEGREQTPEEPSGPSTAGARPLPVCSVILCASPAHDSRGRDLAPLNTPVSLAHGTVLSGHIVGAQ